MPNAQIGRQVKRHLSIGVIKNIVDQVLAVKPVMGANIMLLCLQQVR